MTTTELILASVAIGKVLTMTGLAVVLMFTGLGRLARWLKRRYFGPTMGLHLSSYHKYLGRCKPVDHRCKIAELWFEELGQGCRVLVRVEGVGTTDIAWFSTSYDPKHSDKLRYDPYWEEAVRRL